MESVQTTRRRIAGRGDGGCDGCAFGGLLLSGDECLRHGVGEADGDEMQTGRREVQRRERLTRAAQRWSSRRASTMALMRVVYAGDDAVAD
jgi:hypothetical protein